MQWAPSYVAEDIAVGMCGGTQLCGWAISRPAVFRAVNSRSREGRIHEFLLSVLQGQAVFCFLSVKEAGEKPQKGGRAPLCLRSPQGLEALSLLPVQQLYLLNHLHCSCCSPARFLWVNLKINMTILAYQASETSQLGEALPIFQRFLTAQGNFFEANRHGRNNSMTVNIQAVQQSSWKVKLKK